METRKIQTVGGGTYTVSLPKDWAQAQGIRTGDSVTLHTHMDGVLALQAKAPADEARGPVRLRVDHDETAPLERLLRAAYTAGSREVQFDAADEFTTAQRRVVERVARNLTGVSITEESASHLRIQTLLDTEEVSVQQSVRQLTFVALSMHRDATAAAVGERAPGDLADRDDQADRVFSMIDRSLALALARLDEVDSLGLSRSDLFELWATTRELERVADHAEAIAATIDIGGTLDDAAADAVRDSAQPARDLITDAVDVVLDGGDVATAQQALRDRDKVCNALRAAESRFDGSTNDSPHLRSVLQRLRRTAEHGGKIAEFGLRQAVRRDNVAGPLQDTDAPARPDEESPASSGG